MAKAIVTTLRPNANETPKSPIPTCGKAAARTALPQPANVSQNVPIASAVYFFAFIFSLHCRSVDRLSTRPHRKLAKGSPPLESWPRQGHVGRYFRLSQRGK